MFLGLSTGLHPVLSAGGGGGGLPTENLVEHWKKNTGITQSGGLVSAWTGVFAGKILGQPTSACQTTLEADGSISWNETDSLSLFISAEDFILTQPCTVYMVAKETASAGFLLYGDEGQSQVYRNDDTQMGFYAGPDNGGGELDLVSNINTYEIVQLVYNGVNSVGQIDDTTPVSGAIGNGGFTGFILGNNATDATGGPSAMAIKELIFYSVAHDDTQRAAVREYLAGV